MKKLLIILLFIPLLGKAQGVKNIFKYSTFYAAVNGGTSLGDDQVWSNIRRFRRGNYRNTF